MAREQRKKASDVFRETQYLFSKKVPFKEAFPQIETLKAKVEESASLGAHLGDPSYYDEKTTEEYIDCSNPLCYGGGFSIGGIIREMVRNKETHRETTAVCKGNEGSPKGRRIDRKCLNMFKVNIDIKYQEQEKESGTPPVEEDD